MLSWIEKSISWLIWIWVILVAGLIIIWFFWPCIFLALLWKWSTFGLSLFLFAYGILFICLHQKPNSDLMGPIGIVLGLLGIVIAMMGCGSDACKFCNEISQINKVNAEQAISQTPIIVPCRFRIDGINFGDPSLNVYVFVDGVPGSGKWSYFQAATGGESGYGEKNTDWVAWVDLCSTKTSDSHFKIYSIGTLKNIGPKGHILEPPVHDCQSQTKIIQINKEPKIQRPLVPTLGKTSAILDLYLGEKNRHRSSIVSRNVTANIWYSGFLASARAEIDWGEGEGWEKSMALQGKPQILLHTYKKPGKKIVTVRIQGAAHLTEKQSIITILTNDSGN